MRNAGKDICECGHTRNQHRKPVYITDTYCRGRGSHWFAGRTASQCNCDKFRRARSYVCVAHRVNPGLPKELCSRIPCMEAKS